MDIRRLHFSGRSSRYVEIPNNGGLETKFPITILAWVNRENDNGPIFNYGTNIWAVHLWIVDETLFGLAVVRQIGQFLDPAQSPSKLSKSWQFVGLTYDYFSDIIRLWLNGNVVAKPLAGSAEQSTQFDVRIGAKDDTNDPRYFKGRICCIQVYSRALNQQEVIAVQNRTINTGGYWCIMRNMN